MRLALALDETLDPKTAAMDGTSIRFYPDFVDGKSDPELRFVMAHEVLHCAMKHPFRFGNRDHEGWNLACDYAINLTLKDAGFTVPPDAAIDEQYRDPATGYPLAAEIIYARFPKGEDMPRPGPGQTKMEPAPDKQESPEPDAPEPVSESDWDIEAIAAEAASNRAGKSGGGAARAVAEARKVREDWREVLQSG